MSDYTTTAVGVFPGLDESVYRADPGINISALKLMDRSPLHAKWARENPSADTPAKALGRAVHMGILDPEAFAARVVCAPGFSKRTTAGRAEWDAFLVANAGKTILSLDEMVSCEAMVEAVAGHPLAAKALATPGWSEVAFFWVDPKTGLRCKGLMDRYAPGKFGLEIKTTRSAVAEDFDRDIHRYGYHNQNAWYMNGILLACEQSGEAAPKQADPLFILVENAPPYGCAMRRLDPQASRIGELVNRAWLDRWAECVKTGVWPGYAETIETCGLPKWAQGPEEYMEPVEEVWNG